MVPKRRLSEAEQRSHVHYVSVCYESVLVSMGVGNYVYVLYVL